MRNGSPTVKRNRGERDRLVQEGILVPDDNPALLRFTKDHVFSSRSLTAGIVIDGNSNGDHWKENPGAKRKLPTSGEPISRLDVETAMDAYDRYRHSGEHGAIFDAFPEPRDYWVRSTRERPNRVYPSKPLVGFLRGKTQLNGGWGQKTDAAAQLHNAGFIIVDGNDTPVSPPERYQHLISNADRIRLCTRNYYVEPAREKGATEVAIRASEISRDMGLRDAFPAICSALGGEKFQKLANVPAPTHTLPNPSSSTVFTYQLASAEGHETMSFEPMAGARGATSSAENVS